MPGRRWSALPYIAIGEDWKLMAASCQNFSIDELRSQARKLETEARVLDPKKNFRQRLSNKVMEYVEEYLEQLPARLTYDKTKPHPDNPFLLQEEGEDIEKIVEVIDQEVDSQGLNPASAGYMAYIPGGGLVPSAWGDFLAAISNRYTGVYFASPGGVSLENTLVNWMCQLIGWKEGAGGTLSSGGSIAQLTAVVNARDTMGVTPADIPRSVIYTSSQLHHSAIKALHIAGLAQCVIREIPLQGYKMDAEKLRKIVRQDLQRGLQPFMVMASAGSTDTGAIDPLEKLGSLCEELRLWYHVDAAYGGAFLLTPYGKEALRGIAAADSVIIDPHKGFFLPFGTGALLVKDQQKLYKSQRYFASYMQDAVSDQSEVSPADLSPELSRHFRGLRMWLPLRLFGLAAFRAALEEKLWLARYFHARLSQDYRFEIGPYPELSVTIFRYLPSRGESNDFNQKLARRLQQDGRVFLSSTTLDQQFYLRMAVLNFRTHIEHIDLALELLDQIVKDLEKESDTISE